VYTWTGGVVLAPTMSVSRGQRRIEMKMAKLKAKEQSRTVYEAVTMHMK
jgi:hypothetical protein